MTQLDVRTLIRSELARRTQRNPRYSLRAFAKASGVSHTVLSLVLNGKRPLSRKAALKLADFLGLDPEVRSAFLTSRDIEGTPSPAVDFQQISLDTFAVISDWYHYAILSLLELETSRFEARWIARALSITENEAQLAIDRLTRLGLVEVSANGRARQSSKPLKVENTVSTSATRLFHRQLLEKALEALESVGADERDYSSMTLAMDPALVPYARKRIQGFRRELSAELEAKGKARAVYQITMQVFPVSQIAPSGA
jgi:transcriptional regulator with XRE-family HTH domain